MAANPLQGAGTPAATVFVGNLAYDLSDQDVIDYFSKVGPVKAIRIVTERETGKPRGFGFVEFYDIPTAESCIRNLSGSDLNGRVIRIVFAEGGPGDFKPRREDERPDDRPPRRSAFSRSKMVGADLAYHSSQGMGVLLGQTPQPNAPADQLTTMLARKTRSELYEYLAQMQSLLHQNPQQARQVLVDNPQLARALFQMEIILGMVGNPLGDIAPKGIAPPGTLPGRHQDGPPPGPMEQAPPGYAQPPHNGMPPPHGGPGMPAYPAGPPMPYGAEPAGMMPPPGAAPLDPRLAPPPAAAPMDPRLQAAPGPIAPGPRPMVSAMAAPPPQAQAPPVLGAPSVPGMTPDQQQALLQQVMGLTPEQIELLPPQQKAQVLALQQQLRVGR